MKEVGVVKPFYVKIIAWLLIVVVCIVLESLFESVGVPYWIRLLTGIVIGLTAGIQVKRWESKNYPS